MRATAIAICIAVGTALGVGIGAVTKPASAPMLRDGIYALRVTYVNDVYLYLDPVACQRGISFIESNIDVNEGTRFVDCVWIGGKN